MSNAYRSLVEEVAARPPTAASFSSSTTRPGNDRDSSQAAVRPVIPAPSTTIFRSDSGIVMMDPSVPSEGNPEARHLDGRGPGTGPSPALPRVARQIPRPRPGVHRKKID